MNATFFILDFSLWYYTQALRDIFSIFLNFIWFITHFFSMPLLARSLFAPWKRMTDEYHRGGIQAFLETSVMNIMTRVVGAVVRLIILAVGAGAMGLTTLVFLVISGVWIFFPVVLIYTVLLSATLLV